jgi:hypothetical protein
MFSVVYRQPPQTRNGIDAVALALISQRWSASCCIVRSAQVQQQQQQQQQALLSIFARHVVRKSAHVRVENAARNSVLCGAS